MRRLCNGNVRVAAALVSFAAVAAPEKAVAEMVTLSELEAVALRSEVHRETSAAAEHRADAEVDAARAGLRPTFWMNVSAIAAPGSNIERVETLDGRVVNVRASPTVREQNAFRPNARYEGIVQLHAPLYDGQNRASIEAAEAYRAATRASSNASQQHLLTTLRAAYLDWLSAHLEHEAAAAASEQADEEQNRIAERVAEGDGSAVDLDTARYRALQMELEEANAEKHVASVRMIVESIAGTDLSPEAQPDVDLLHIDFVRPTNGEDWEATALEREGEAAREEARMHRKSRSPVLAIVGQTGMAGVNDRVFPMYQLGFSFSVPLWDGGRAVALARAAEARAVELEARARDARLAGEDAQARALLDQKQAEQQLVIAEELVAVAERRVEHARAYYELGEGSLEAVADARAALRDAESRRVQSLILRADAILRLTDDRSPTPDVFEP